MVIGITALARDWLSPIGRLGWRRDDWSDFSVRLNILAAPISYKRAKRIIMLGGKPSIGLTPKAKVWMQTAVVHLRAQWAGRKPIPRHIEINARVTSYLPTRRLIDASNLYQGPEDALQAAGVITDDVQIRTHDGSDRHYDKGDPRVEIVLTPYERIECRRLKA